MNTNSSDIVSEALLVWNNSATFSQSCHHFGGLITEPALSFCDMNYATVQPVLCDVPQLFTVLQAVKILKQIL